MTKSDSLLKVTALLLLGFTAYKVAIIAGNTSTSAVALSQEADYMLSSLEDMSPAMTVADKVHEKFHNAMLADQGRDRAAKAAGNLDPVKQFNDDVQKNASIYGWQKATNQPPAPVQKAQAAKSRTVKGFGVTVNIAGDWVTLDGKPAALDETTESAKVYSQGLYQVIIYKSGKVALLKERVVQGFLK